MKKLLLLFFSLTFSFNSYSEWVYIDKENNSDTEVYVLTDSIEIEDGYVYWTYLNNYSKPRSEYNIMGVAIFRGAECENNRYINIESQMFQGSMGTNPFGERLKPEQEWTTPSSGQIDEKIFNYVCDYLKTSPSTINVENNTYEDGKAALDKLDYQTAYSIFLPLAVQGNHDAQDWLSFFYEYGYGVSQDDMRAFYWKRKAAESGNKIMQYQLGNMYYQGRGTTQSFQDAANWFRKAAERGHASSQIALAFKYLNGEGALKNPKEAFNWFMKAALQGRAEAQYAVGYMYYEGEGVLKNTKEAFNWFMKAALQGDAKSQYYLGRQYFLGEGTLKSLKDAAYWVKKAYENESDTSSASEAEKVWNDFELWKYIDNQ